jgi:hypothetical protein
LKKADWGVINHHVAKREREGKESDVLLHDVLIPPKKVRKEMLRNCSVFSSEYIDEGKQSPID